MNIAGDFLAVNEVGAHSQVTVPRALQEKRYGGRARGSIIVSPKTFVYFKYRKIG